MRRVEIVPDVRVAKEDIQLEHYQLYPEFQAFIFMSADKEVAVLIMEALPLVAGMAEVRHGEGLTLLPAVAVAPTFA